LFTALDAREQIIGGAPRAAVNSAVTSMGAAADLTSTLRASKRPANTPERVPNGAPPSDENAKVASVIPISRCIVAPFMVPASCG